MWLNFDFKSSLLKTLFCMIRKKKLLCISNVKQRTYYQKILIRKLHLPTLFAFVTSAERGGSSGGGSVSTQVRCS